MTRVGIAELKAHLSEHLRAVRRGRSLIVLDRDTPIARIVPITDDPIEMRAATRRPKDLRLPEAPAHPTNSLEELLEDRGRR